MNGGVQFSPGHEVRLVAQRFEIDEKPGIEGESGLLKNMKSRGSMVYLMIWRPFANRL